MGASDTYTGGVSQYTTKCAVKPSQGMSLKLSRSQAIPSHAMPAAPKRSITLVGTPQVIGLTIRPPGLESLPNLAPRS